MPIIDLSKFPSALEIPYQFAHSLFLVVINFLIFLLVLSVLDKSIRRKEKTEKFFLFLAFSGIGLVNGYYLGRVFSNFPQFSSILFIISKVSSISILLYSYLLISGIKPEYQQQTKKRLFFIFLFITLVSIFIPQAPPFLYLLIEGICVFIFILGGSSLYKDKSSFLFILSISIHYVLSLFFGLPVNTPSHASFEPIGSFSSVLVVLSAAYMVIKHRRFNIKVFVIEVLTFSTWIVLLVRMFLSSGNFSQGIYDILMFLFVVFLGILVIRSVQVEIDQKEKMRDLSEELKRLDSLKNEFINMAAHELRAPLTAIKGFLSMVIAGDAGKVSPEAKEFLRDSAVSAERMIRLVNNMLNVSRIEEGRMMFEESKFKLGDIARGVYEEFKFEAEHKKITMNFSASDAVKDTVLADPDKIHEVLVNLISNALKYTTEGSITISLSNKAPGKVLLSVTDTGIGISEVEQKKLFRKFYRVQAQVGKTIGTGLGLYICKLLVERFGGELGVFSDGKNGSTFWFEMPTASN